MYNLNKLFNTPLQKLTKFQIIEIEKIFDWDMVIELQWANQYGKEFEIYYTDNLHESFTITKANGEDTLFDHLPDECDYLIDKGVECHI